jgi:hypothetical protein
MTHDEYELLNFSVGLLLSILLLFLSLKIGIYFVGRKNDRIIKRSRNNKKIM